MARLSSPAVVVAFALVALVLGACADTASDGPSQAPAGPAKSPAGASAAKAYEEIPPSKDYPLKTCVVSGDDLGAMGDPMAISYQGTEVQFCCPGCVDDFLADPETHLAKVRAAGK